MKQIMPVETQGSPVNVFENQNALTVLSADGKSLSQMVTTRPLATQKLASFKCGVKRWDLGQEDTAECTSMGKLLFCMHTDNEFMFVTLSVPSTGAIIVSDNVGPLTQPRWSQSSGVLRVCLFNRLNHLAVYDLTFDDANASEMCRSLVCKAESMWARKLAKTRLPGTSIEAMPEIVEDLGLPLVPQEAQEFMIYPDGFECDESKSWNPVNDQLEIKFLGNYSNALLKVQENGGQLVLGPVSVIICLRGHSGNTLSARFVATSSLDAGNTDFLNIDLAAINSVFVDTRASSGNMIVLQLPSRDMSLTFYNESANNQNWTQPSLFEWVDIVNQAQSRILSGNAFVARRRAHILEVENLINDAKTRRTLWLEEQLAIAEAKEEEATAEVEDAAIEVAGLKGASTAADGQHVGESSQAENVVAVATKEETLPEKAINAAEDVYSLQTTQEDLLKEADYKNKWNKDNEASAVTLTEEDMADSTEASQKKMRGSKSTKTASSSKKGRRDSTAQSTATTGRRGDDDDDREDENADPKVKVISLTERLEQQLERVTAAQAETAALESTFIELCVQNRRIREFNVA